MKTPPFIVGAWSRLSVVTDGQAKLVFAGALAVVALLGYVEVIGSPGAVVRKHIAAAEIAVPALGLNNGGKDNGRPIHVPGRPTITIDRQPLNDANDDASAAFAALTASQEKLRTRAREKLGIEIADSASETLRKNPSLDRAIRSQTTGRQSWQHLQDSTRAAAALTNEAPSTLRSAAGSRELNFERVEDFNALVSTVRNLADRLHAATAAVDDGLRDVEHLAVLQAANKFEQKLKN
jgi:hypothetical protein